MKKKSKILLPLLSIIIIGGGIIGYLMNETLQEEKPYRSFIYTDFGVYVPNEYSIYGIDVSKYQSNIHWEQVKKMQVQNISIDFVFIKATEGKFMKDKNFEKNWKQTKENYLIRGAYHYYLPDGSPEAQAQNYINTVQLASGDLPPVIDIEDRGIGLHKTFIKNINIFISKITDYCSCQPIIYTYDSFYQQYLKGHLNNYPIWIARYGSEKPELNNFDFWQFTDHAQIDGIGPVVDMNVYSGDSISFQKLLLK